jgi:P-type E1-E2 ATPase
LNTRKAFVLDPVLGGAHPVTWANVRVGDVVKIEKDTEFPADLLLLHAAGGKDIVYVDTMNLDGETNLKEKYCFSKDTLPSIEHCEAMSGEVQCDTPNESLEEWDGNIHFSHSGAQGKVFNAK